MERTDWNEITEKLTIWQWIMAAMTVAILGGIIIAFGKNLPPQLPLFYSLPWGEEQLAKPEYLGIPAGLTVATAMIFPVIAKKMKKDAVLGTLLAGSGLTAEIIMTAAILRIIIQII